MKVNGTISIGKRKYVKGDDLPWFSIYPFFMLHMLLFGGSGFFMAYAVSHPPLLFMYAHGGIAILAYTLFYLTIFGRDEVKWMFINSALATFGIYSQIGWLLSLFGKQMADYPLHVHITPFLYYVLYTFLLRQAVIDMAGARESSARRMIVDGGYVIVSTAYYLATVMIRG